MWEGIYLHFNPARQRWGKIGPEVSTGATSEANINSRPI